ncbi:DUF4224 domain-containing protein [Chitinasiproducens palmae]|uniref:DUF4224 domain-containing protein n=1 Tax=Chitinasiproducens palmae TaxID=1770053 RepID=A0A1H2PSH8_9BURK|nr:DUF4224 domain-containing protein [Chitinasiproducens palmae]SDV49093.1 protein of unknown function [Chitinasiproducens palmae]
MNESMFLTRDEVRDLTYRTRRDAQASALTLMGIEHKIRPDGSVAVLREHVTQQMGIAQPVRKRRAVEPDWSALHAARA